MNQFVPVVRFEDEKATPLSKVDSLLLWLADNSNYPFEIPKLKGVFECEGTRVLLHYWLILSVMKPAAFNDKRIGQMCRAFVTARHTSNGFMRRNIQRRLDDFATLLESGFFDNPRNPSFAFRMERLKVLVENFRHELRIQDVSDQFVQFGIPELLRINDGCVEACEWVRSNHLASSIEKPAQIFISRKFERMRESFEEFRRVAAHKPKVMAVRFGTDSVCDPVINWIEEISRAVRQPSSSLHKKWLANEKLRNAEKDCVTEERMLQNAPNNELRAPDAQFVEEVPMDERMHPVARKNISSDEELNQLVDAHELVPDGSSRDAIKADLWLRATFPNCCVVYHDERVGDDWFRNVAFVGDDASEAGRIRLQLVSKGVSNVEYAVIEDDSPADAISHLG